jgi:hypothetical protein
LISFPMIGAVLSVMPRKKHLKKYHRVGDTLLVQSSGLGVKFRYPLSGVNIQEMEVLLCQKQKMG